MPVFHMVASPGIAPGYLVLQTNILLLNQEAILVHPERLELSCLAASVPKTGASANFATGGYIWYPWVESNHLPMR